MKYFAYGSNLLAARLCRRVPGAVALGRAFLAGHERRFHKRGRDGSGKCSVLPAGSGLWGAVFELPRAGKRMLDRIEGVGSGYREIAVRVRVGNDWIGAFSYRAEEGHIDDSLVPFGWYKDLVVAGARERRLPAAEIALLNAVPAAPDPDADRARRERRALAAPVGRTDVLV